jgi:hypothetical protein
LKSFALRYLLASLLALLVVSGAARAEWLNRVNSDQLSTFNVTDVFSAAEKADIATGSPTLDLKAKIQMAVNALGTRGGRLYFPPGTYRWDSPILLTSKREIVCAPGAVFKPLYNFALFVNDKYKTFPQNPPGDTTPPTDANQVDRDITIEGCEADFTGVSWEWTPSPINGINETTFADFWLAQNVKILRNKITGNLFNDGVHGWRGFVRGVICRGVSDCLLEENYFKDIYIGLDVWGGSRHIKAIRNRFEMIDNETAQLGNAYCVGVNGMSSYGTQQLETLDATIEGNYCLAGGYTPGMQFDALGVGSATRRVSVRNNRIVGRPGTTHNGPIHAYGDVSDISIVDNKIKDMDNGSIWVQDKFSEFGSPSCTDCISTTNGSDVVTIADSEFTSLRVAVGAYILFSAGTTNVGGIAFASKYFEVLSLNPGVSVTVKADVAASSTASGGGAITMSVYQKWPSRVTISDNKWENSGFAGQPLIRAVGEFVKVANNSAFVKTFGPFTCNNCLTTTLGSASVVVTSANYTASNARVNGYLKFDATVGALDGITFANKHFKITAINPGVSVTVLADVNATGSTALGGGSVPTTSLWESYGTFTHSSSRLHAVDYYPQPVVFGSGALAGSGFTGSVGDNIDNYVTQRAPRTPFPAIILRCGSSPVNSSFEDGLMWCNTTSFQGRRNATTVTFSELETAQTISGVKTIANYTDIAEMTAPAAPPANTARLYADDNGAGKTRLMVRFPTGAVQQLAIEP